MKSRSLRRAALMVGLTFGCLATFPQPTRAAEEPKPAGAATPAVGSKPSPSQPAVPSDTTMAERTIRITWLKSPGASPPDVRAAIGRLDTPEVAGKIGQEVIALAPDVAAGAMRLSEPRIVGGDSIEVDLTIDLNPETFPKARPAAKEFADRLIARFTELLAEERNEQDAPKLKQAKQWAQDVQYEWDALARQIKEKAAQMGGQSPEGARAALGRLEDERQKLELELTGLQARQKAVEEWIDRTSKQMQEQGKADPVIAELEKAVVAQEKLVSMARKQFESGTISQSDVGAFESKLSDVKIQLMERKRGPSGGTDPLAALNRELQNLSIDLVDRKARFEFVDKRITKLRDAAAMASDYESLEAALASLRREMEQARQELRATERSTQGPGARDRVVVIHSRQAKH